MRYEFTIDKTQVPNCVDYILKAKNIHLFEPPKPKGDTCTIHIEIIDTKTANHFINSRIVNTWKSNIETNTQNIDN